MTRSPMPADLRQAMESRYAHAVEVCRLCAEARLRGASLPAAAERAAVVFQMPIPELNERLDAIVASARPGSTEGVR